MIEPIRKAFAWTGGGGYGFHVTKYGFRHARSGFHSGGGDLDDFERHKQAPLCAFTRPLATLLEQ